MAQTEIEKYIADLPQYERRWLKQIDDYTAAYTIAFNNFKSTLGLQKAANDRMLDLTFAALSIVGGAALMRAFGATAFSAIGSKLALEKIIEKEMELGLKVYDMVAKNATASFALGQLIDTGAKEIGTELKTKYKAKFSSNLKTQPHADPLVQRARMSSYCRGIVITMHEFAAEVRDSKSLSAAAKDRIARGLQKAQLASRKKTKSIDDGNLSNRIELSLHLNFISKLDSLWTWEMSGPPGMPLTSMANMMSPKVADIPIPQSRYKMPKGPNITSLGKQHIRLEVPVYKEIGGYKVHVWSNFLQAMIQYDQPGSIITKKANTICKTLGLSPLYVGRTGRAELLRAESYAKKLRLGQIAAALP